MKNPPMSPDEFRDYLSEMSSAGFERAMEDPLVRECLETGDEYAKVYRDVEAVNRLLQRFEVPEPRVNIGARVMGRIAAEEHRSSRPTLLAAARRTFTRQFAVPAWSIAALLALLVASAGMNILQSRDHGAKTQQTASGETPPAQPDLPIIVMPEESDAIVPAAISNGTPMMAPVPAWIVIMGAPPTGWIVGSESGNETTLTSRKENRT